MASWHTGQKKKGCTEADDARGDHTTVPLEILNLSFVQLVPKRKYSRRRREGVVSRGGGMGRYLHGEHVSSGDMADRQRRVVVVHVRSRSRRGELPLSSRLVNVGFRLGHVHRSDGYSWYIKYRGAVFSPNDEDLWDGR